MYIVYIDESRRDDRNRVVLGGIVIHDKYIQNVNNIFTNIILSEVNRIVNENKISSDDLIIHMKEFINDKDMVNKLLKNIGIRRDQITEIKRRIIFNIVEALADFLSALERYSQNHLLKNKPVVLVSVSSDLFK
nr:DUF3800 domain-containing protein [Sulfolobus islandicus]